MRTGFQKTDFLNSQNLLGMAIALVAGLGAAGLTALLIGQRSPATYADCILAYAPRNSGPAVGLIAQACREKYPEEKLDFSAYATDESKRQAATP